MVSSARTTLDSAFLTNDAVVIKIYGQNIFRNPKLTYSWWNATGNYGIIEAEVKEMTIGKRISELKKHNSYSQEYIAEKVGVSRQAVSKWEQGQSAPDTYNLIALAELLNVSVEYLATGKKQSDEVKENKGTEGQKTASAGTQRILGFIILSAGALSLILGILFSEILLILALFMIVCGILCLILRKNAALIIAWVTVLLMFIVFYTFTGIIGFRALIASYSGMSAVSWMSIFLIGSLLAVIAATLIVFIKKERKK